MYANSQARFATSSATQFGEPKNAYSAQRVPNEYALDKQHATQVVQTRLDDRRKNKHRLERTATRDQAMTMSNDHRMLHGRSATALHYEKAVASKQFRSSDFKQHRLRNKQLAQSEAWHRTDKSAERKGRFSRVADSMPNWG